jgi:hypothetical protein
MAVSGHNGNNETHIGLSTASSLSLHDENKNEISVSQSKVPISITLKRDPNLPGYQFQYVNATSFGLKNGSFYLPNGFNIATTNASLHILLEPLNLAIGYLIVIKLGYTPIVNATYADYTSFKIMCPSKKTFILRLFLKTFLTLNIIFLMTK